MRPIASSTSATEVAGVAPSRSKRVRALAERRRDLPGDCEHLPPVLEREIGRDERAGALARLDDDGGSRESGNDPVAGRKSPRRRLDPRLVLRDHEPAACHDRAGELGVCCGIVAVDTAPEDRDRRAVRGERSAMRLAVDAARHTADDHRTRSRRFGREEPRDRATVARAGSRSDDRERGAVEELELRLASEPQPGRRIRDVAQERRVATVTTPKRTDRHAATSPFGDR